jgi:hypothetical protein
MADKLAKLSKTGSEPEVEIVVGFAQFAKYRFELSDAAGATFTTVFQGDNADSTPDKFTVTGPVTALDNRILRWKVIIAAFDTGPGQMFSVTVGVKQDGQNVPDGPFTEKGPLDQVKVIQDQVRFTVS